VVKRAGVKGHGGRSWAGRGQPGYFGEGRSERVAVKADRERKVKRAKKMSKEGKGYQISVGSRGRGGKGKCGLKRTGENDVSRGGFQGSM